jgi:hypothetical protein
LHFSAHPDDVLTDAIIPAGNVNDINNDKIIISNIFEYNEIDLSVITHTETINIDEILTSDVSPSCTVELDSVNIQVPISRTIGVAPLVKHIDGDYKFDKLKNILIWQIANIDKSNSNGSIEFSVSGVGHVNDFFPINVNFSSQKSYCDLQIAQVCHISDLSQAVKHSLETNFTVDQYNII